MSGNQLAMPDRTAGRNLILIWAIAYRHVYVFILSPRNVSPVAQVTGGYAVLVDTRTGRVIRAKTPVVAATASQETPESPFQ